MGKLRTHEDKKVADLAKETVRKWKNDVAGAKKPEEKTSASTTTGKPASPTLQTKASLEKAPTAGSVVNGAKQENPTLKGTAKKPRDANSDNISKVHTGEKTRDSSILLLYNAIVVDSDECTSLVPNFFRHNILTLLG